MTHPSERMSEAEIEWADVDGFDGYYKVSNRGEIVSLQRVVMRSNGCPQTIDQRTLSQITDKYAELREELDGYINLYKEFGFMGRMVDGTPELLAKCKAALDEMQGVVERQGEALELGIALVSKESGWGTVDRMEGWRVYEDADNFREAALAARKGE